LRTSISKAKWAAAAVFPMPWEGFSNMPSLFSTFCLW
jgi:hypothetical protein